MNRQHIHFYWRFKVLLIFLVLCWGGGQELLGRLDAEQEGDPRDSFLGADRGDHATWADVHHAAARAPGQDCLTHLGCADNRRVAVRVGGLGEGFTDEVGGVVDGGSDAQITDSPGMRCCTRFGGRKLIPGEFWQVKRAGQAFSHTSTLSTVTCFRLSIPHSEAAALRSSNRRSPGRPSSGRRRGCPVR